MRFIILFCLFIGIVKGQECSKKELFYVDVLSSLNIANMSKNEFDLNHKIENSYYISNTPYLYNELVTLDDKIIKNINNKFFRTNFLLSNKSKFLIFKTKDSQEQYIYMAVFLLNKKLYYFNIKSDNIASISYEKNNFIDLIQKIKTVRYHSGLISKNYKGSIISFYNMIYNKEVELMANGFLEKNNQTKTNLLVDMIFSEKNDFLLKKQKKYNENFVPSYNFDFLFGDNSDSYTEDLTVDEWSEKLRESHSIQKNITGRKIKVALIDSGFQREKDFQDIKQNSDAVVAHGTHVGGIIWAVNSNIELISYNAFNGDDPTSKIAEAIEDAINKKVDIINLSIEGTGFSKSEYNAFKKADELGIVIVVAAGNGRLRLDSKHCKTYPACYKKDINNIIIVGNLNDMEEIHYSSNYGELVDVFFHGENIQSLAINKGFRKATGTSQATPFITGLISQFLSKNEKVSNNDIKQFLNDHTIKKYSNNRNQEMTLWKNEDSIRTIATIESKPN